ncbi:MULTISPECIES: hypothetical protein [Geodermatophilus]|uniref:SPW repeat-containing protein n=1 Tax=Geodermatophilus arenarius TaxID=1137990 RepID=A0ABV9LJX6_9ACTN
MSLRTDERTGARTRTLVAWAGIGTSVASALAVAVDAPQAVRLVTVLAFVCAGPGAAVLAHVPTSRQSTSWALTDVVSLAVWGIASAVTAWLDVWSPTTLLLVLAAGTVASCAVALLRVRGAGR